jgi:hypothetical protein
MKVYVRVIDVDTVSIVEHVAPLMRLAEWSALNDILASLDVVHLLGQGLDV